MFELTRRNSNMNTLRPYNPFHEMEQLQRRFFGSDFDDFFRRTELAAFQTDVTDEGDYFLLEADLPGFRKEDIHLEQNGDTLTIRAERHSNVEQKEKDKVIRTERSYGAYSRSFDISGIHADGIRAAYEDGVLKLRLPKEEKKQAGGRQIEIE